jgi:TonB family protein
LRLCAFALNNWFCPGSHSCGLETILSPGKLVAMHSRVARLAFAVLLLVTAATVASAADKEPSYNKKNPLWDITRVDVRPTPIEQALALPPDLAKLKIKAEINLEYVVNRAGTIEHPRIVKSTEPRFNEFILEGVRKWKFNPAKKDGEAVNCRVAQALTVQ